MTIAYATSFELEPLRCRTCEGTGRVDGEDEYLAQLKRGGPDVYMTMPPYYKRCRVCSGTGRHVSRARAGLAAPPTVLMDIETDGLYPHQRQAMEDLLTHWRGEDPKSPLQIIDDVGGPDTPEQREKVKEWFTRLFPQEWPARMGMTLSTWSSPLWTDETTPPLFPDGVVPEAVAEQMAQDLEAYAAATTHFILGDPPGNLPITDAGWRTYLAALDANDGAGILFIDGEEIKHDDAPDNP
ncbi:hypothetical protein DOMOVOI_01920 [Brevundimonas phage vB_BpoS-Domovoi]|uniref:Uncharacterized protein n=1 Tax=Brevundimonas phage vB_BpoS-Domovoi TaxID=2948598 RepID=A0A9E7SKE3_9CAUD|nr:hypothetical protein DOMOVOI_01920 [Brevundimonas phage vB_BpoS-Domovoi]